MHMLGWLHEEIDCGSRFGLSVVLGILALLVWTSATASPPTPAETLRSYYRAIDDGNCEQARRLRPGYSEKSCRNFTSATLEHVEVHEEGTNHARLNIRVRFSKQDTGEETFAGSVELERWEHGWIIKTKSFKKRSEDFTEGTDSAQSPYPEPAVHSPAGNMRVRLLHGSEYLLRRCWNQDELGASQGKDEVDWEAGAQDILPERPPDLQDWLVPDQGIGGETIRSVHLSTGSAAIALTFNLIERAQERSGYDGALVDVLRRRQVPATFFASGKWILSHPKRTRQLMVDPLFELGLLGWDHRNLALLDAEQVELQLLQAEAAYKKVRDGLKEAPCTAELEGAEELSLIAPTPNLFRFPYGRCATAALGTVSAFGVRAIQWSLVLDDIATDSSLASIREQIEPLMMSDGAGTILVGHGDGRGDHTAEAMQALIPTLEDQGYEFVTVSQLLSLGEPDTATTCYEHEPNDNQDYDMRFSD